MIGWFWAGLLTGLAANELCQISEWAAKKLVCWSTHVQYEDPERAEIRSEELARVIEDRPGQLFKLITAIWFVLMAVRIWAGRAVSRMSIGTVTVSGGAVIRITVATTMVAAMAAMAAATVVTLNTAPPELSAPVLQGKSVADAQTYARTLAAERGWGAAQFSCLNDIYISESGWRYDAQNPSGAYGIPQALPGSKMGGHWRTDPATQIRWGLQYIAETYGTPCRAWSYHQVNGVY